jgi:hypothetical protein
MENDFGFELEDILNVVDTADVLLARFQILDQRLLIDMRSSEADGPMLTLVPRAGSAEERFRGLKRLRPRFPLPDRILSFQWPRDIVMLKTTGVWQHLCERLAERGMADAARRCEEVYQDLLRLEHQEVLGAVRGSEGYKTIWSRHPG